MKKIIFLFKKIEDCTDILFFLKKSLMKNKLIKILQ